MPSGDKLIELFQAFKDNNQVKFTKIAYDVIEEEKRKNHYLLANKLEKILFDCNSNVSIKNEKNITINNNIPLDKESGFPLVEMKFSKTEFDDVIIKDKNKIKIDRIIEEFINREILESYKVHAKTKVLFCGPPGCGKTLTAEAIANKLGIPMLYTRFDSVISSFLGETATNLRKIFDFSRQGEWVLFFDEFDSIGKSRDSAQEHGELKRVVNSYLQLIDNYPKDKIVIAATNYEKLIDKALWRRFDEIIFFDNPETHDIENLVKKLFRNFPQDSLDIGIYLENLNGLSFADIERICMNTIKTMILSNKGMLTNELFYNSIKEELDRKKLIEESLV